MYHPGVRRSLIAIIGIIVVVAVGWYLRRAPQAPAADPPAQATRITPDLRRQIADRIAAAHAMREAAAAGAAAPTPRPELGDPPLSGEQLEALKTPILTALRATFPFLKACFEKARRAGMAPGFQIQGKLVLTGDPDVGTLVDADRLTDDHDQPLPPEIDDCLRGELQTIELPPLREGDKVSVTYVFSDDK